MRISIKVHPRARQERVEQTADGGFEAWVLEPPEGGRANRALVALLAVHFGVAKSEVRILRGASARRKLLEIGGTGGPTGPAPSPTREARS